MRKFTRPLILGAALAALGAMFAGRKSPHFEWTVTHPLRAAVAPAVEAQNGPRVLRVDPAGPPAAALSEPPPAVMQGDAKISGIHAGTDELKALDLTEGQLTTVQALQSHRDLRLEQLRAGVEEEARQNRPLPIEEAGARARSIHQEFLDSLKGSLLPDQWRRVEALIQTGRWGGYAIQIRAAEPRR